MPPAGDLRVLPCEDDEETAAGAPPLVLSCESTADDEDPETGVSRRASLAVM